MADRLRRWIAAFALAAGQASAQVAPPPPVRPATPPVRVMLVGTFHFDNPGLDYRNLRVDDMLAPARQREIAALASALGRFRPTRIGVEWTAERAARGYAEHLAGTAKPARGEVVQLAFRIARAAGLRAVDGLDVPMGQPFEAAMAYAAANGQRPVIDEVTLFSEQAVARQDRELKTRGVAATLRLLNDPANDNGHHLYRQLLKVGGGAEQPGAEVAVAWYRRNLLTCAKLLQAAKPGDRVLVFYGAGHLPLLRQCVTETPGYELVDPLPYLPSG